MKCRPEATARRTRCNICQRRVDPETVALIPVRCNVRRFVGEVFHMWQCQACRCMHCWEVVDLDRYYNGYGVHRQKLDFFHKLIYRKQLRRFRQAGYRREHRLLDYGCGAGLLTDYLRRRGYENVVGYDPYGQPEGFANGSVLEAEAFDFICLQDVIEHVEEPDALLAKLSKLLRPGGSLYVGMPCADEIDLHQTHKYLHQLHLPYHLHIYTREALVQMGRRVGLEPVAYYRRYYVESLFFGMNEAFLRSYLARQDDTIDALLDPVRVGMILRSPKLLFHGLFGYFYSPKHSLAVVFRKHAQAAGSCRAAREAPSRG